MKTRYSIDSAFFTTTAAVICLWLAACSSSPSNRAEEAAAAPVEIRLLASEFQYQPKQFSVPAGQPVNIVLDNRGGAVEHDLVIAELGFALKADAGRLAERRFVFDRPGHYLFQCSMPGHKESGMQGALTVGSAAETPTESTTGAGAIAALPPGLSRLPQPAAAPPVRRNHPQTVQVALEARAVNGLIADGIGYRYWTYNGTVPGPMIRVRQGDSVELSLKNALDSPISHSIDSHGVTGPGGGAKVTQTPPGTSSRFRFKALKPGVYVYHCATPMIPHHIANGMYGLMVVEPPQGWPKVDREFYVMQGDFYLNGDPAQPGLHEGSPQKMATENPDYVVFNGAVGSLAKDTALRARVGDTVRIFFGVGGPNKTSSFHVIGEMFDRLYPEAGTEAVSNVQTTLVPAGGAAIADFKVDYPGSYILVDHSLGRLAKGSAAFLEAEGPADPEIFQSIEVGTGGDSGH
jgi:nitrite reductase (NO-forming)